MASGSKLALEELKTDTIMQISDRKRF